MTQIYDHLLWGVFAQNSRSLYILTLVLGLFGTYLKEFLAL